MKAIIENGSTWPLEDLDFEKKIGNHKGAINNPKLSEHIVMKDIIHYYALPLPLSKIHCIPGVILAPTKIQR